MVINMLDNFGLFEITYYKPSFLISSADALLLLSTKNPYTLGVFHQILFGDYTFEKNNFHLLKYLQNAGKSTMFIGREHDVKRYDGGTPSIIKPTDMATWIEGAKILPKMDFTWLNYLDFEEIYKKKQYNTGNPEEIIQKLIRRTDKWILSSYRQLRSKTLMIILGNHGRYKIDMQYQGKVAEWRAASVPLAIFMLKL
jgi:hypothetical protein